MEIRNNASSPNFGMAFRIGKGGKEFLSQQSEKVLTRLGEIGDEMKDYKHWDLFVTEKGYEVREKGSLPHIYNDSVKLDPENYKNKYCNNSLQFDTYIGAYANKGEQVTLSFDNLNATEVKNVKDNFEKFKYDTHEKFAEFVRFLERRSAEKAADEAAKKAKDERINGLVNDLVSKFSTEA